MKKTKKKHKKWVWNKKTIVLYLLAVVLLGSVSYFLGSTITKAIMDAEEKEKKEKEEDVHIDSLTDLDTIKEAKLEEILSSYNEKINSSYAIDENKLNKVENGEKITIDDITFLFQLKDENVQIITIEYEEETEKTKQIVLAMIEANNQEINEEEANTIYENVKKTRETTKKETYTLSEFFQYKGIEASEKTDLQQDIHQFRIGRITEN